VFLAYLLVRLREAAPRRLSDVWKASRGLACIAVSGVARGGAVSGGSGEGAGDFGRVRPRWCRGAPVCLRRTVTPVRRVFVGRPRLPVRRASRHSSNQRLPERLSPAVSKVRAPVGWLPWHKRRRAFFNNLRSFRPPRLSHSKRVARSLSTRVHPGAASGATFFWTLVYSSSPSIICCRHGWGKANKRRVF
jgi:hypothetical protein